MLISAEKFSRIRQGYNNSNNRRREGREPRAACAYADRRRRCCKMREYQDLYSWSDAAYA